MFAIEVGF